jgi:hypothetical protein
LSSRSSLLNQR